MVRSWCRRTAVLFVLVSLSAGLAPYALGQQASDQETSDQPAAMQESAEQEGAEEVAKEQQAAKEKAAEKAAIVSANPLRPANTASPRDTLESFITSVNEAVQRWRANEPADAI